MPLVGNDLAKKLADALGQSKVSDQLKGWANAVVKEVKMASVTTGNIPGPHSISAMDGNRLAKEIAKQAGYPGANAVLIAYATAITTHVMANGKVTYTAPPPANPPKPPQAWFLNGTIAGMVGPLLAKQIATALKQSSPTPDLIKKATAIVEYIQANALVNSGSIS